MPTAILLDCDGTDGSTTFADRSANGATVTAVGNAKVTTTSPKFGSGCLTLDGSGDYLTTPGNARFAPGTQDFTADAWVKTSTSGRMIFDHYDGGGIGWQLLMSGTALQFYTSSAIKTGSTSVATGNWTHVCVMRASGQVYLFVNGVAEGSPVANSQDISRVPSLFAIGAQASSRNASYDWNGQIDAPRVFIGAALFSTSGFTPPASQPVLPVVSGIVYDDTGAGAIRTVRVYRRDTGVLVGTQTSASDGTFSCPADFDLISTPLQVVALDDAAGTAYNDLIYGSVLGV